MHLDRLGEAQGFSGIARQTLKQGIVPAFDVNRSTRRFPARLTLIHGNHSGIRFPAIGVDLGLTTAGRNSIPQLAGRRFRAVAQCVGHDLAGVRGEGNPHPRRYGFPANVAPDPIGR